MHATLLNRATAVTGLAVALATSVSCGHLQQQGRSPSQVVVMVLEGASGAQPAAFGGTLDSDVITNVTRTVGGQSVQVETIFNDLGRVTLTIVLKDPGVPGVATTPSSVNQVTINRYRVSYRRSDGRNVAGVDVPFPFESATTVTVPASASVTQGFELVRTTAKQEAPLAALRTSPVVISTVADVTFYGQDLAGNAVSATGSIGILFGNFSDPQ